MKFTFAFPIALIAVLACSAAHADNPQMYRWTDPQGVIHFSDQPPKEPAADLTTSDIPVFPAVDQAKVDEEQAALLAQAAALQRLAAAQAAADAQTSIAATQEAAAQPQTEAVTTDDSDYPAPIYVTSAFVPRSYRRNLYLAQRPAGHSISLRRPIRVPPITTPPKP